MLVLGIIGMPKNTRIIWNNGEQLDIICMYQVNMLTTKSVMHDTNFIHASFQESLCWVIASFLANYGYCKCLVHNKILENITHLFD